MKGAQGKDNDVEREMQEIVIGYSCSFSLPSNDSVVEEIPL